jgi:hypothetical protein
MKKNAIVVLALAFFAFLLSSCLTVEKKEYKWELTGTNSGKLTITYINIMSDMDDETDVSQEDFDELLNDYLYGSYIENRYPMASNIEKRLFVKNNQLWGEVTMEFTDLQAVHLYQHDKKGPYMFCVNTAADSESYEFSDGEYGGEYMPVAFWDAKSRVLNLTTHIQDEDESMVSLVGPYYKWKE